MQVLTPKRFSFAGFEIDGVRRQLMKNGELVHLKSKAFDLLLLLVEHRGEVLSKNEILEAIWENQFVEEGNLTVHISALRKALGEKKKEHQFIVTVPGRGYSFIGELCDGEEEFLIESRNLSHIIVEEKIETAEIESSDIRALNSARKNRFVRFNRNRAALIGLIFVIISSLGAAHYFWQRESAAKNSAMPIASIKRLTENGKVSIAALSPDGKLFAYATAEGETNTLWLGHADGGASVELRPPVNQIYMNLRFAPDGGSIYYVASDNYRNGVLYRMPVFGGAPEKLRDDVRWEISFAPDGNRFVFVRYDEKKDKSFLVIADLQSAGEKILAEAPTRFGFSRYTPAWSPDGATIAVGTATRDDGLTSEIFAVNVADGAMRRLTGQAWEGIIGLTWRSDGTGLIAVVREKISISAQLWQIAFPGGEASRAVSDLNLYGISLSQSADGKNLLAVQMQQQSNVWVAPADNFSAAQQVTFASLGQDNGWNGLAWTPDGRLAYTRLDEKGIGLWQMNADGSNQKQLIPAGGENLYPTVTSDGRYIVFQSNRGGATAVWRADADGGNLTQLTHEEIAAQPAVSPDGKWIIYNSDRTDLGELRKISIEGGESQRLSEKQFSWAAVSPDSKLVAAGFEENKQPKLAILSIEGGEIIKFFDAPRLANFRLGVRWTPGGDAVTYRDWTNGIWKQNLSGGEPQRLKDLPKEKLFSYAWSPDAKQFAFVRGTSINDVVLINSAK